MNILILNCGSSSLKFQIIATDLERIAQDQDELLARGVFERLGSQSLVTLEVTGGKKTKLALPLKSHKAAVEWLCQWLSNPAHRIGDIQSHSDIHAVGHRIVHGGEALTESMLIGEQVLKGIEDCIELAPLHNPANLEGVRAATAILGGAVPQVAVFDTAFHATMPESSFLYAIPYQYYRRYGIRRYGFHGTSHRYVAYRYRRLTGKEKSEVNVITLHLGNGCSACAIKGGRSIDTSMGMTPLEGLVMGTRSGDIDPAILEYLSHKEGGSLEDLLTVLNKQSGLLGVSGLTNDMRELMAEESEHGDRRASLAIELFCGRVRRYIGSYLALLNGADALIFTGGIGENAAELRERICAPLSWLGIVIDPVKNRQALGLGVRIDSELSRVAVYVIPTNEELMIARDTVRCVEKRTEPDEADLPG